MNNNYMRNANMRNCGCSQQNRNMQQRNAMPAVETYNKNKGLMSIYELGFAMTEALLYLDTHPDDAEAIEYYNWQDACTENTQEAYRHYLDLYPDGPHSGEAKQNMQKMNNY